MNSNLVSTTDIKISYETHRYTNSANQSIIRSFNYQVKIACDSTLLNNFATPNLANYSFVKWQYIGADNKLYDIQSSGLLASDTLYLIALYTPKAIEVRYYVENSNGAFAQIKGIESPTSLVYGDSITLPYVVVELDDRITNGWTVDKIKYSWGDTISLYSKNNTALTIDNGKLVFPVYATTISRYYVVYSAGDTSFDISNYNTTVSDNSVVITKSIEISGVDYYYIRVNSTDFTESSATKMNTGFARLDTLTIPDKTVTSTDNVAFIGWSSKSQVKYNNGEDYKYKINDVENGVITLTELTSNYVEVNFYITDPTNKDNILNLSTKANQTGTITHLTVLIDKLKPTKILLMDTDQSTADNIGWKMLNNASVESRHFTVNALSGDKTILDNYKFYGWSLSKYESFSDISSAFDKADIMTIYNSAYNLNSTIDIYSDLSEILQQTSSPIDLYAVWETKYQVIFEHNNNEIASGMYGRGEKISAPNPTTNPEIINGTYKWLGWVNKVNSEDEKLFTNNALEFAFESGGNVTYTTKWEQGYMLI